MNLIGKGLPQGEATLFFNTFADQFHLMRHLKTLFLLLILLSISCKKDNNTPNNPSVTSSSSLNISTDKATYLPGETVVFKTTKSLPESTKIRYWHLNQIIEVTIPSGTNWSWTPPMTDFQGYLAEIYTVKEDKETVYASIAIDVSSDWTRFPRYGFLSEFPQMTNVATSAVLDYLLRHRINGIQFYDWQFEHHKPLAGSVNQPDEVWKDIANRDTYFTTVKAYIDGAHSRGMKAMFYNLAYGALNTAPMDGVSEEWYLFRNTNHTDKDYHPLPSPMFRSNIYLTDPSNIEWQRYLSARNDDVYQVFDFDGFHIDQLGNRNHSLYNYDGQLVDLPDGFNSFITAMKTSEPDKKTVMNAVNQYGQEQISNASVDFLYSEVWNPNNTYQQLAQIITENNAISGNTKNTVLAAYMNYDLANSQGFFNTPAVLLTNSVILAFGGNHLELGEHMLAKEYFPNKNLQIKGDLRDALVSYYDFQTAYENLLRDGGTINLVSANCTNNLFQIISWPPQSGKVAAIGKQLENSQIVHLVNFVTSTSMLWRDNNGTQAYPDKFTNFDLKIVVDQTVKKIWFASPDYQNGVPQTLEFQQSGNVVSVTVPSLYFWDMIVLDY